MTPRISKIWGYQNKKKIKLKIFNVVYFLKKKLTLNFITGTSKLLDNTPNS